MDPVVVVAHARSGSNCLVEIVGLALSAPLLNEPFNERFPWGDGPEYRSRVHDAASLDAVIDEILAEWAGLKVLSYQLDLPLLSHLLLRPDVRVIRLRRRNLLETAVSTLVAQQTGLWKTWDHDGPLEERYHALEPIPVADVEEMVRYTRVRLDEVDEILDGRDGPTLRIDYEDLYLHDTERVLASLWSFLGVPAPSDERLAYYLDPAQVQMARPETYGRVPNIAEIEAALGGDDVGHLTYL